MPKKHYDWSDGPAELQQHSVAKHKLLKSYLAAYFKTLGSIPSQDVLRVTLVDGFAGGGAYVHKETRELHVGSPFICLEAVEEAEKLINHEQRSKKTRFDIDYFYVEKDKSAASHLEKMLRDRGYGAQLGNNLKLLTGDFNQHAENIIEFIAKKSPRNGRSIFVLDQYGYKEVPMPLLAKIFDKLPKAEVILTFNVDAFSTYATSKSNGFSLESIGIPQIFPGKSIEEIKSSDKNWRAWIQSQLYPQIVNASGAKFHTPFFIRSKAGHGDFWLLHLSMHHRARDVMTNVHWEQSNTFIHYAGAGLDMFKVGHIVDADEHYSRQSKLGFTFDDDARNQSEQKLLEDIPRLIHAHEEGMNFESLFASTCNTSPATSSIYKTVLSTLAKSKDLEIITASGGNRTSADQIKNEDRIIPSKQAKLFTTRH